MLTLCHRRVSVPPHINTGFRSRVRTRRATLPSNISKSRLSKAFNEGRRSAKQPAAENPYDNPKLRRLWDEGRTQEQAGQITTPIPALEHGETRAQRTPRNPPRPKPPSRSPSRPSGGRSFGDRGPRSR